MTLFDVYPLFDITPVRASGCNVWDSEGNKYLDFYGGHAVISIGHSHPHYIKMITEQVNRIGFYSNSVQNPLQVELAGKLGEISGCPDYRLFLCNSGAEANENAIKLASFTTGKKKFISFSKGFHGRTSAAVALTDNPKIVAPVNQTGNALILPFNQIEEVRKNLATGEVAAVIVEGIQGIGGINIPEAEFIQQLSELTKEHDALLIIDEVQSGYGRSGKFFAHQYFGIQPDIITVAKGMGNGFPVGGVLIRPGIESWYGMLGTTFGGNHLACAASIAVLDVLKSENLVANAASAGQYLIDELQQMGGGFEVRGKGLMIGLNFPFPIKPIREKLLREYKIFTGVSGTNMIRLLPPLCISKQESGHFISAFKEVLSKVNL